MSARRALASARDKIPGPFLRKVSFLPTTYQCLRGREPQTVRDLHQEYGNVVRVSPDLISFTDPGAWKEIYGPSGTKKFKKIDYRPLRHDAVDLLTADPVNHPRQRAAVKKAFSEKALREQERYFKHSIDQLVEQWSQADEIDLLEWLEYLAFDLIGTLAFSNSFETIKSRKHRPWLWSLKNFFKSVHYMLTAGRTGIFFPLIIAFGPFWHLLKGEQHLKKSAHLIQERLKMPADEERHDFWSYVDRQNDSKEGSMSIDEMEVNAALFIAAGSDTISSALAGTFYLLLRNPSTLTKLQAELDDEFATPTDVTMLRLGRLPYLNAVVHEALRMYPPIPGELRRLVPAEGATISDRFIPGGNVITIYALAMSDNADNFANPKLFAPERWLSSENRPTWAANDALGASQPFSIGPRDCVGMPLAYAELKLILARILLDFDLQLMDNAFDISKQTVRIMWDKPALKVRVVRRQRGASPHVSAKSQEASA